MAYGYVPSVIMSTRSRRPAAAAGEREDHIVVLRADGRRPAGPLTRLVARGSHSSGDRDLHRLGAAQVHVAVLEERRPPAAVERVPPGRLAGELGARLGERRL